MNAVTKPGMQYLPDCDSWMAVMRGHEPVLLEMARRQAYETFRELGLPDARSERWRYTRLDSLERGRLRPAPIADVPISVSDLPTALGHWRLVFVDGRFAPAVSMLEGLPVGVGLRPWSQDAEGLAEALTTNPQDGLQALNQVLMSDGAVLAIAPEITLEQPLEVLFVAASTGAKYLRNAVDVGAGARVAVIERFITFGGGECYTSSMTRVDVADRATVEYYRLVEEGQEAAHHGVVEVSQGANSHFGSLVLALGAQWLRNEVEQAFGGVDATARHDGLFVLGGRQHADLQLRVNHAVGRCTSRSRYRGVAGQRARGVFDGRIAVQPDAQRSDAHLRTDNLLLSPDAEIDCKPQLEIFADDVKCGHGATMGRLNDDVLFYLRARGIEPQLAKSLMTFAFANEIVDPIADVGVRRYGLEKLLALMPQGSELRGLLPP